MSELDLDLFRAMLRATPYFWPAFAIVSAVAVTVGVLVWRRNRSLAVRLAFFGICTAPVIAATLTSGSGWQLHRMCGIALDWAYWSPQFSRPEALLNVVLFIPFGISGYLLSATLQDAARWLLFAGVMLASPVIEFCQWLFPGMGRMCQGADITANTLGTIIGVLIGAVVSQLISRASVQRASSRVP